MTALLEFRDASVGYGAAAVAESVTFGVECGRIVGLVGPNAAGKTTLLRAVTGEATVTRGEVVVGDVAVDTLSAAERARRIGVLPQAEPPSFSLSARDYVMLGRHARLPRFGGPGEPDEAVVDRVMSLTDTSRLSHTPADALSGGDLQRLTLAQALAQEPELLLLDEPTSHLDLDHTLQVLDLVRGLADRGMAVLAVFHDLGLAARYCDSIAVVAGGRIVTVGTPDEVIDADLLSEVFHVKAVVTRDVVTGTPFVLPIARDATLPEPTRGRVLFVCGSGSGAGLMRRTRLAGFDVVAAALSRDDTDGQVARALGVIHVGLAPFAAVDERAESAVADLASTADAVVVCATPFGAGNLGNLRAGLSTSAPVVFVGAVDETRDFSGGLAGALAAEALERGAHLVATREEAFAMLERIVP